MSQSRRQPKGKFKSESFKGTLGCTSSKEDVQGKRELKPDKGAFTERKCFCALSTWVNKKRYSTSPQENEAYGGMSGAHGAFSWGGMGVKGLITAGSSRPHYPSAQWYLTWGLVSIRNRVLVFGKWTSEYSEDLLLFRLKGK